MEVHLSEEAKGEGCDSTPHIRACPNPGPVFSTPDFAVFPCVQFNVWGERSVIVLLIFGEFLTVIV